MRHPVVTGKGCPEPVLCEATSGLWEGRGGLLGSMPQFDLFGLGGITASARACLGRQGSPLGAEGLMGVRCRTKPLCSGPPGAVAFPHLSGPWLPRGRSPGGGAASKRCACGGGAGIVRRYETREILSGHRTTRPAETRRATAHRLPRAEDRAACILPRTANPAEGGAAGQDAGAHGLSTRPGPGGARRAGASPGPDAGGRSTDALARARWQVARDWSSQAGRPRTWWTACCGWQRQRTGPPQPESAAGSAASRAAWSRRDAYQQITCPSVPALLQRPVRPSEEMAGARAPTA